jgi:hypothetical protein
VNQPKVIRSKKNGCFKMYSSNAWGKYLVPADDPEGLPLTKFERNGFQLKKDFPVIPSELWSRYIALCFYMCPDGTKLSSLYHDSQMEVQVCLLRDAATLTKWKIVVPNQTVSGVSVHSELNENIDIVTGERYKQFPPEGWVHAGSSHSHNTMDSFFSSTDDKSELTVPGLHIVIGNVDHKKLEYTYKASIVLRKNRKIIKNLEDVVDTTPVELEFHEDILEYINAIMIANNDLYTSKGESDTSVRFWSKDPKDLSEIRLFDDDGKPDGFLYGLDKTNSDLFDDVKNLSELQTQLICNEDVQALVKDQLKDGFSMDEIIRSMEEAKKDIQEEGIDEV